MKNEVGTPVIIAVIVIALLVVGGIAWSIFGKKGGATTVDQAQWLREHPESSMAQPPPNPADHKRSSGAMPGSSGQPMSGGR